MPVHLVWISMINRLAFNYDINPAILTEGMLWFKDLSSPDPFGILPFVGGLVSLLNIMSTTTTNLTTTMRKLRRYLFVLPLLSIPIWMTFPVAFNIYWIFSSLVQLVILNLFRNIRFREMLGVPQFLPGTKLERLNIKTVAKVEKPTLYKAPPSKKKIEQANRTINK